MSDKTKMCVCVVKNPLGGQIEEMHLRLSDQKAKLLSTHVFPFDQLTICLQEQFQNDEHPICIKELINLS